MNEIVRLVGGLDRPESLAWDPRGSIYTGNHDGLVLEYSVATGDLRSVGALGGRALGMAIDGAGSLFCCDQDNRRIWRLDPKRGTRVPIDADRAGPSLLLPNALVFSRSGVLFVSDSGDWESGGGRLFRISEGRAEAIPGTESDLYPNGLAIDPAHRHLYLVESRLPGVVRFALSDGGTLGPRSPFWTAPPGSTPDGITFTARGALLVSFFEPSQIILVREGKSFVLAFDPSDTALAGPTNVAFFGRNLDRLAAANIRGSHLAEIVIRSQLQLAGSPLAYPKP